MRARAEDSIDDVDELTYEWSFGYTQEGRESSIPVAFTDSGIQTMTVRAIDSEGGDSGWIERWIDVRNLPPVVEPLPEVMAIAEEQFVNLQGVASDTPSDLDSLKICWDTDPGMDSDGIGSADDDCDVEGENLTHSWRTAGTHAVVFHATDDDGARSSSSVEVTVLNLPPLVRIKVPQTAIAEQTVVLDASGTLDSSSDIDLLRVYWDVDCSVDSDGDGVKDNDADLQGFTVEHEFPRAGMFTVKAIAWDEDISRTSSKSAQVEVDSPDMTAFEEVVESLTGEESSPFLQLTVLALIIAGLAIITRRKKKSDESVWEGDEREVISAPISAPSFDEFDQEITIDEIQTGPPLPEDGLPEGWTMEQWAHYGPQYLENLNESGDEQNQM